MKTHISFGVGVDVDLDKVSAEYGEDIDEDRAREYLHNDVAETLRGGVGYSAALSDVTVEPSQAYTKAEVADAVNAAANDILDAVGAGDEGLRDAMNLVVNATLHYLEHDEAALADVVADNYEANLDEVLDWIGRG